VLDDLVSARCVERTRLGGFHGSVRSHIVCLSSGYGVDSR